MGAVSVTISGKSFRMACDDGQEAHLEALAHTVDKRITELKAAFGEIGDQRLTVMAAISLADEASDLGRRLAALEADVEKLKQVQGEARDAAVARDAASAALFDALTARVERIVDIVEGRVAE